MTALDLERLSLHRHSLRLVNGGSLTECNCLATISSCITLLKKVDGFDDWLKSLRDIRARLAIAKRINRTEFGNFGDHKAVGEGVSELRIDVGQGYRVYYTIRKRRIIFLLCGGNKSTQQDDIKRAISLAKEV